MSYLIRAFAFFSIFKLFLFKEEEDKIVEAPFKEFLGSFYTFLYYDDRKILLLCIDTLSEYTKESYSYIGDNFNTTYEPKKKDIQISVNSIDIIYPLVADEYTLSTHLDDCPTYLNLSYAVYQSENYTFKGPVSTLAFAHKISEEQYSITHTLFKKGDISKPRFSFVFKENQKEKFAGFIYFGGIPSNVLSRFNSSLKIPLPSKNTFFWEISIPYIFIGEISYVYNNVYVENKKRVIISTSEENILVPSSMMDVISKEVFSDLINTGKCKQNNFNEKEISCYCTDIPSTLKEIHFFEEKSSKVITIQPADLFSEMNDICHFLVQANLRTDDYILGTSFLDKFASEFSYDEHSVTLYDEKKNFADIDLSLIFPYKKIMKWGMYIILVVFVLIVAKCAYSYFSLRKKRRLNRTIEKVYTNIF